MSLRGFAAGCAERLGLSELLALLVLGCALVALPPDMRKAWPFREDVLIFIGLCPKDLGHSPEE
jgi:hypothetical protein